MRKIKVLIISHAYVEKDNLRKIRDLSSFSDLEIGVLFPEKWKTWHGENKVENQNQEAKSSCEKYHDDHYRIFTLPAYFAGDGGLYFYNPRQLGKILKSSNPDIIHLEEEPWTPLAGETSFLTSRLGAKLVFFSWENLDVSLNLWRTFVEKYVFRRAAMAIVGNRGARERLTRRGFSGPIEVLPQFGVDVEKFKSPASPAGGRNPKVKSNELKNVMGLSGFVVGFVGRLTPEKGLEILFRAMAKVGGDWSLLLLSTSSELPDYFQKLAKELGIMTRIKLAVGVPHDKFPEYFGCMDTAVLPSLTTPTWVEQFGRVLVEALACGVPVIGSSSGAIPEVIGGAGLIFAEGKEEELAEKISLLVKDVILREQLSWAGQERVSRLYSNSVIAEKTHAFYQSLS